MKKIIVSIVAFSLLLPISGQVKSNFNNMSPQEIRQFLLNQKESEPALKMVKKHNTSRISSYGFAALSLVLAVASTDSSDDPSLQSGTIVTGFLAGTSFAIAGILGITASERLKKAKNIYLNTANNVVDVLPSQIRNESEIIDSIFKYPTPR